MSTRNEASLRVFKRKILRKIYGRLQATRNVQNNNEPEIRAADRCCSDSKVNKSAENSVDWALGKNA